MERHITYTAAPYSDKYDQHLEVHLKYPNKVPAEFLKEFEKLLDAFGSDEKY